MDSSFLPAAGAENGTSAGGANNGGGAAHQPPPIREQDRLMPIANVIRIMRRVLPAHAKISDDAKETIQECVSEYISFITGEANERCQREQRKTITAEDVLWAMSRLGFDDYVDPLSVYLHRYREFEGEARGVVGLAAPGGGPHPRGGAGAGDHHPLKSRGPGGGVSMLPHHHHHHDMQMHAAAAMYPPPPGPPPHHGGFLMPHPQGGSHHYLPYPYEPTYGGEHAAMAAYYGGGAAYAPGGNGGGSGDGSGSGGGSASNTPQGGGGFDHPHPFAYK